MRTLPLSDSPFHNGSEGLPVLALESVVALESLVARDPFDLSREPPLDSSRDPLFFELLECFDCFEDPCFVDCRDLLLESSFVDRCFELCFDFDLDSDLDLDFDLDLDLEPEPDELS